MQLYNYFIATVRENLHVVFCVSPIGSSFRNYCRMYPSLVNCTTINWFLTWPPDALAEVAMKFLTESSNGKDDDGMDEEQALPLAQVFGRAHTSVIEYSDLMLEEMKRHNYVTPTNYLELVTGYVKTLKQKEKSVGGSADKLRNGLHKLTQARFQVEEMSVELEVKQDIVQKKQKECQELLVVIVEKRMAADEQQKTVEADSARIEKEAAETKILADDAQRDLAKAMPALEAAVDALNKLDKKSISEVKAYAKPPEAVMKTMNAVMTCMEKPANWASAKVELAAPDFLTKIKFFDKDNISNSTMKKMDKYIKDPTFTEGQVTKVSLAAGALCSWVHAMSKYTEVSRTVEPKRLKLKIAQDTLEKKLSGLEKARAKLEVQCKRRAHDEAVERDRARHRTATDSSSSAISGPHVSCGAVVLTPLVEAHRRYVAASATLARPSGDHEAAKAVAHKQFGALCAAWGVLSPPAEVLVAGSTPAATVVGIQASHDPAPDSETREATPGAVVPDSRLVPAPTTGGRCGGCCVAGALGVITACTAIGWAVAAGESSRFSMPANLSAALRRLPVPHSRSSS